MKYNSKAVRLSDVIVRDIWEGRFDGAKYLPGEDVLAREYEVSRTTIRRVLDILNREGVLIKEPNRGSLINPDLKSRLSVEDLVRRNPAAGEDHAGRGLGRFPRCDDHRHQRRNQGVCGGGRDRIPSVPECRGARESP